MSVQPTVDILKKKREVMRGAFARLCNTLEGVTSRERPDGKGDSRILADLELLREKADDLTKLDDEILPQSAELEFCGEEKFGDHDRILSKNEHAADCGNRCSSQ